MAEWMAYFNIYPFTVEREEMTAARALSVLTYTSGRTLKTPAPESTFLPDYLGTRQTSSAEKTLEQQKAEWKAFKEKLRAANPQLVKQNES